MKHRNSVLHGMLGHLPWQVFDELVAAHGSDKWVRTLSTKCQLVALLIGQLSGFCGLRETVSAVNSQAARLYHLGAREIARSTFADANAHRPSAVFEALFAALAAQAGRGLRRTLDGATYLIDSTSLRLTSTAPIGRATPPQSAAPRFMSSTTPTPTSRFTRRSAPPRSTTSLRLDTGKVLRILTNDLVAPAHEIADLYKQRWQACPCEGEV